MNGVGVGVARVGILFMTNGERVGGKTKKVAMLFHPSLLYIGCDVEVGY